MGVLSRPILARKGGCNDHQQATVGYTYADYCRLPDDGKQYEVIDGVLYMAPATQSAASRGFRLSFFVDRAGSSGKRAWPGLLRSH